MDLVQWIGVFLSPLGFWKIGEMVFKFLSERKKVKAEIRNLETNSDTQLISNWVKWAGELERKIDCYRQENISLQQLVEQQRKRITSLESRVAALNRQNKKLRYMLSEH